MYLSEILDKIDGIDKNTIYFYDKMGYINPRRVNVGKIEKRIYSKRDLERIKTIWKYHKEGYSPRNAYKKAIEELENEERKIDEKLGSMLIRADKNGISLQDALLKLGAIVKDIDVKRDLIKVLGRLLEEE